MKILKQFKYNYDHQSYVLFGLADDMEVYYSFDDAKSWRNDNDRPNFKQMILIVKEFGHLVNFI